MIEKEELMKAVELSSDSCDEKGEQEIKVTKIALDTKWLPHDCNIHYFITASGAMKSNSVTKACSKILIVHADGVSKSLCQKFFVIFFSCERPLSAWGKILYMYFVTTMDTNRDSAH